MRARRSSKEARPSSKVSANTFPSGSSKWLTSSASPGDRKASRPQSGGRSSEVFMIAGMSVSVLFGLIFVESQPLVPVLAGEPDRAVLRRHRRYLQRFRGVNVQLRLRNYPLRVLEGELHQAPQDRVRHPEEPVVAGERRKLLPRVFEGLYLAEGVARHPLHYRSRARIRRPEIEPVEADAVRGGGKGGGPGGRGIAGVQQALLYHAVGAGQPERVLRGGHGHRGHFRQAGDPPYPEILDRVFVKPLAVPVADKHGILFYHYAGRMGVGEVKAVRPRSVGGILPEPVIEPAREARESEESGDGEGEGPAPAVQRRGIELDGRAAEAQ